MSLNQLLNNANGNSTALIGPQNVELNYLQLKTEIASMRRQLSLLGLRARDAVSIALPNSIEFVLAFLGVSFSALVAAPLNFNYTVNEFAFYLEDMRPSLLIVPKGGLKAASEAAAKFDIPVAEISFSNSKIELKSIVKSDALKPPGTPLRAPKPKDIAFVLHTSGTTGRPKAVPLLHSNMLASVRNIVGTYKLTPNDRSFLVMPLFHVHGLLAGLLAPLGSGGSVVIAGKFSGSRFWSDFISSGANWYTAVPTIHQIILKQNLPKVLPKIRFIRSCSSSLAPTTFKELETKLQAPVLEAYAMTEACHQMTSNSLPPDLRRPGTVGVGHGVEVVILNNEGDVLPPNVEGEIGVRGPNVTPGYLNNPKANQESFTKYTHYFRTGDQGKLSNDNMLTITGRIKELINRGGEKISPIELDSVLLSHPKVSEAVAFGAPDKLYGQQVQAVVVADGVSETELKEYMSTKVAKYKVPTKIYFTKVMPKTATGKIQRRLIAQKFATLKSKI